MNNDDIAMAVFAAANIADAPSLRVECVGASAVHVLEYSGVDLARPLIGEPVVEAEWFDVLPMFNGTLIRNFIYQENVTSRLFTLLAFIHLGAPLIAGVLAWVHVQRVPRAHINPPREIAIAFTAAATVSTAFASLRNMPNGSA